MGEVLGMVGSYALLLTSSAGFVYLGSGRQLTAIEFITLSLLSCIVVLMVTLYLKSNRKV